MTLSPHDVRTFTLAAACLFSASAQADCVDGTREPRAAEQEFHRRATAALIAALPAPPAGAETEGPPSDFKRLPSLGVLCSGNKVGDFTVSVKRRYLVRTNEAESKRLVAQRKEIDEQILALLKLPPDKAAERSALEQKAGAADYARNAAVKAGDKATAEARLAETTSLYAAATAVDKRHRDSVKPQVDALQEQRKAFVVEDQQAVVGIAINLAKLPVAASNPIGAYGSASPQRSTSLKVVNVGWSVGGPSSPLREALAAAMPEARLKALVGPALPSEAESEALAPRASPQERAAAATATAESPRNPAAATASATAPTPAVAPATAAAPAAPDPLKQATGAVQTLRGLLGR